MDNSNPNTTSNPNIGSPSAPEVSVPVAPNLSQASSEQQPHVEKVEKPQGITAAPQELGPNGGEGANQNAGMVLPQVVDPAAVSAPIDPVSNVAQPPAQPINKNPAMADDVDIIEKEWVDRAKKIVDQTRDDPHRQEQEVEKLQIDYLKKRYGKEIKTSDS